MAQCNTDYTDTHDTNVFKPAQRKHQITVGQIASMPNPAAAATALKDYCTTPIITLPCCGNPIAGRTQLSDSCCVCASMVKLPLCSTQHCGRRLKVAPSRHVPNSSEQRPTQVTQKIRPALQLATLYTIRTLVHMHSRQLHTPTADNVCSSGTAYTHAQQSARALAGMRQHNDQFLFHCLEPLQAAFHTCPDAMLSMFTTTCCG